MNDQATTKRTEKTISVRVRTKGEARMRAGILWSPGWQTKNVTEAQLKIIQADSMLVVTAGAEPGKAPTRQKPKNLVAIEPGMEFLRGVEMNERVVAQRADHGLGLDRPEARDFMNSEARVDTARADAEAARKRQLAEQMNAARRDMAGRGVDLRVETTDEGDEGRKSKSESDGDGDDGKKSKSKGG